MGGRISPSAVLVISNGTTKLVNVKNQDGVTKVLDMVPDLINRFAPGRSVGQEKKSAQEQKVDEESWRFLIYLLLYSNVMC